MNISPDLFSQLHHAPSWPGLCSGGQTLEGTKELVTVRVEGSDSSDSTGLAGLATITTRIDNFSFQIL